jgi:hypothetical protein
MNHDSFVTAAKVVGLLVATTGLVRALGAPEFARATAAILQYVKHFANWQLSSPQALFKGVQRNFLGGVLAGIVILYSALGSFGLALLWADNVLYGLLIHPADAAPRWIVGLVLHTWCLVLLARTGRSAVRFAEGTLAD